MSKQQFISQVDNTVDNVLKWLIDNLLQVKYEELLRADAKHQLYKVASSFSRH